MPCSYDLLGFWSTTQGHKNTPKADVPDFDHSSDGGLTSFMLAHDVLGLLQCDHVSGQTRMSLGVDKMLLRYSLVYLYPRTEAVFDL